MSLVYNYRIPNNRKKSGHSAVTEFHCSRIDIFRTDEDPSDVTTSVEGAEYFHVEFSSSLFDLRGFYLDFWKDYNYYSKFLNGPCQYLPFNFAFSPNIFRVRPPFGALHALRLCPRRVCPFGHHSLSASPTSLPITVFRHFGQYFCRLVLPNLLHQ